jgi:hypothetical protein
MWSPTTSSNRSHQGNEEAHDVRRLDLLDSSAVCSDARGLARDVLDRRCLNAHRGHPSGNAEPADYGGILFLAALAVGGIGVHRMRSGRGGTVLVKSTMVSSLILIVGYAVAVLAMTGKPS